MVTLIFVNIINQEKKILKLKFTKRLIRLICVIILIYSVLIVFNQNLIYLLLYILPFIIILSNLINYPIESLINKYYTSKAHKKIANIDCIKIGITGSFGKTTTKYYLQQILSNDFLLHYSPNSYNTLLGISKDINNNLNDLIEVYILEMGATKPKDIEKINKLVNIDIGIITSIGTQHLESFKNVDNIIKTKLEILKSNNIKTLFINSDIKELDEYLYPNDLEIIRIGFKNNSTYQIKDVLESFNNLSFKVNDDLLNVNLIGRHNALNLTFVYAVCLYLGIDKNKVIEYIKMLKPMEHRLKLLTFDNCQIIDDSFNSNYLGFLNALESLSLSNSYNILITPGIVEQDELLEEYYKVIKDKIIKCVDFTYLINNKCVKPLIKYLEEVNYSKYVVVDSLKEAFNLIRNRKILEYYTILIENDLTDYYFSRG